MREGAKKQATVESGTLRKHRIQIVGEKSAAASGTLGSFTYRGPRSPRSPRSDGIGAVRVGLNSVFGVWSRAQ